MKKYKVEAWYRYAGGNEKECVNEVVYAENKEQAKEIVVDMYPSKHFYKIDVFFDIESALQELIDYAFVVENSFLHGKLTDIKEELCK